MADDKVYLKGNVQFEPLFHNWYAWYLTVPPVTAALNVADRYLPIMKSYANSPLMHAAAIKNPAMRGGPFIDLGGKRVDEVRQLIRDTESRSQPLLEFARALKQLWALLLEKGTGMAMDRLYDEVPDPLKGYVELYYDLNHNPSYRVFESLVYRSEFYSEDAQSVALSLICRDRQRPFILSTPRLADPRILQRKMTFSAPALDDVFRSRRQATSYQKLADAMQIDAAADPLFRDLFTAEAPSPTEGRVPDEGTVRVRYYGHACILIQSPKVSVMLDPIVSYTYENDLPRFTFEDLPDTIDYVLITHSHHDHIVLETLLQLRHKVKTVVVGRNCDGYPQDPSLQLALRKLGFPDVREVRDIEEIPIPDGCITAIPFMGEHNDLPIQSKNAYMVRIGPRSVLSIADSCNLDPRLYDHVMKVTGEADTLFLGMECEGAPPSWVYGPLFPKAVPREIDRSRRARGCNFDEASALIERFRFQEVYVYAMGQEPWLNHILDNEFSETSPSLLQSRRLIEQCRERGIAAESVYAKKELIYRN
ncbi:MAG TPA: MBL fold metallo-hydrolase [Bryobacteraceae bacterium]|nr:MBL fold metallo-hydrolase [Bryobacteraceae bacterium]